MPVVAIAGGTSSGLGRAITIAILEQYGDGAWTPVILSRSETRPLWLQAVDPETHIHVLAVDYSSKSSLLDALQGVHTCISVILAKDFSHESTMVNLLDAAIEAGCSRYVPSHWGVGPLAWDEVELLKLMEPRHAASRRAEGTGTRVSSFNTGMHMNYLGIGARQVEDLSEEEQLQRLIDGGGYASSDDEITQGCDKAGDMPDGLGGFLVSPATATAELPMTDDGEYPRMTMTMIRDVGRFVAAALDLPQWSQEMNMAGDTLPLDQIVALAEAATERTFSVRKISKLHI